MACPSVYTSTFQENCQQWIKEQSEVLALFRYAYGAGAREYEFFTDYAALQRRIEQMPSRTCVTVWREPQLTLRGHVDTTFIAFVLEQLPADKEWLLARLDRSIAGPVSWYHWNSGRSLTELEVELPNYIGERIALGTWPEWSEQGGIEVSAVVPDKDGTAVTGSY